MNKAKKKMLGRILAAACAVVLVALLAAMPLLAKNEEQRDGPKASILSGTVDFGTVDITLLGSGTLVSQDALSVTVPAAVKLTGWLVSNGDTVVAGDPIASVDRVSVMEAVAQVQETLDYLAQQIETESGETTNATVKAQAGGTVKRVYAQAGDSIRDVMLEHGALAELSLDGLMTVKLETQSDLLTGSAVDVVLPDGTTVSGRVESNLAGVVAVTVADDGYAPGESVRVTAEDGSELGSGELAIHSPWRAVAYAGTVKAVKVTAGQTVEAGDTLMTLQDTGHTAAWQQLVDLRREYEQLMLTLFSMYQTQTVTAPCDGMVSGVDTNSAQLLASTGDYSMTLLANSPNGEDETLYTNFLGKVAAVGQNGWALAVDPRELAVADYKELSGLTVDEAAMTELLLLNPAPEQEAPIPVYALVDGGWQTVELSAIAAGDVLLMAADDTGDFVWLVRIQKAEAQAPGGHAGSTGSNQSGGSGPSGGNTFDGATGNPQNGTEDSFSLYGMDTVVLASVTPQRTATVDITVDELDIRKLAVGQAARVTVDALGGQSFDAVICEIGNTGTSNGGSSKFTVHLTMERAENMLDGMTVTAAVTLDSTADVLTVPVAALAESGSKTVVYTGYDEESGTLNRPVEVETGVSDGQQVQILSGLSRGDTYYYAYYDTLEISNLPDFGSTGFSLRR